MKNFIFSLIIIFLFGCTTNTYVNDVQPVSTNDNFFEEDMNHNKPQNTGMSEYDEVPSDYDAILSEYKAENAAYPEPVAMGNDLGWAQMSMPMDGMGNGQVLDAQTILLDSMSTEGDNIGTSLMTFQASSSQSLKHKLYQFVNRGGYKLVWKSDYDIFFGNDVTYRGDDIFSVLKSIAKDLEDSGVDLHINVYTKNKVVLVYSMRS